MCSVLKNLKLLLVLACLFSLGGCLSPDDSSGGGNYAGTGDAFTGRKDPKSKAYILDPEGQSCSDSDQKFYESIYYQNETEAYLLRDGCKASSNKLSKNQIEDLYTYNNTLRHEGQDYENLNVSYEYDSQAMAVLGLMRIGIHQGFWTGKEILYWRRDKNPGLAHAYNPNLNTWRPMNIDTEVYGRWNTNMAWTGEYLFVWSGQTEHYLHEDGGALYDPSTDSWKTITNEGAPTPRREALMHWTGKEVFIYGGKVYDPTATRYWRPKADFGGALYNPKTDTWRTISRGELTYAYSSIWTGEEVMFLATPTYYRKTEHIYYYNPSTDSWRVVKTNIQMGDEEHTPTLEKLKNHTNANRQLLRVGSEVLIWDRTNIGQSVFVNPRTNTVRSVSRESAPLFPEKGDYYRSANIQLSLAWNGSEIFALSLYEEINSDGTKTPKISVHVYSYITDSWHPAELTKGVSMQEVPYASITATKDSFYLFAYDISEDPKRVIRFTPHRQFSQID